MKTVLLKCSATGTSPGSEYFTKHIRSCTGALRSRLGEIQKHHLWNLSYITSYLQCWVESEIFNFPNDTKQCLHLLFVGLRCDICHLNDLVLNQHVNRNVTFLILKLNCCTYCINIIITTITAGTSSHFYVILRTIYYCPSLYFSNSKNKEIKDRKIKILRFDAASLLKCQRCQI